METLNLKWLIRHRFFALLGLLLLGAWNLQTQTFAIAPNWLGTLLGILLTTNICLLAWNHLEKNVSNRLIGLVLILDTCLLTAFLYAAGGATNPFSIFYLVHITLAAFVLSSAWAWFLAGISILFFGLLFYLPLPTQATHHTMHHDFSSHLKGMWLAFSLAALLVSYLVSGLFQALKRKEQELHAVREQQLQHQRLVSLATLATGAAHELRTPLATISLIAQELTHDFSNLGLPNTASSLADLQTLQSQISRCQEILQLMALKHDTIQETDHQQQELSEFVKQLIHEWEPETKHRIQLHNQIAGQPNILIPQKRLQLVLSNLIKNALEASPQSKNIQLQVHQRANQIEMIVEDQGSGISEQSLQQVFDPFYSTKEQGQGMGLGLFISKHLIEEIGGELQLTSQLGRGTRSTIRLPFEMGDH